MINASLFLGLIGSLLVAQIYRYRRVSGSVERQQTKWVVFAITAWIVVVVVVLLIDWIFALTHPGIPQVFYDLASPTVIILSTLLIPLSIGVAILRYRLWDINLIIKRTLVYSLLSAGLAIVFELANQLLLPFAFQFIPILEDSTSIRTGVSIVIAVAVLKPLYAWITKYVSKLGDWIAGRRAEDIFVPPPPQAFAPQSHQGHEQPPKKKTS